MEQLGQLNLTHASETLTKKVTRVLNTQITLPELYLV